MSPRLSVYSAAQRVLGGGALRERTIGVMTAQPISADQGPDTGAYQVIRLGDQSAVVVPMADFLKLRALERRATVEAIEDAEDAAALEE